MSMYVNGTDLETLGFTYTRRAGDTTPAVGRPPSVPIPGHFGEAATGASAVSSARRMTIPGTLHTDAPGDFLDALRALAALCCGEADGPTSNAVTLAFSPAADVAPTTAHVGYLADPTVFDRFDPQESAMHGPLTLVFDCLDPLAYDVTPTTLSLSTTVARAASGARALGTAWTFPVVTLAGGTWTTRTVTLVDGANTTVASLTITKPSGLAGVGQSVVIDMAAETVVQVNGGTTTPRADWLTAGDFFVLRPSLTVATVPCGLVLDAGTGSATYARAWR